MINSYATKVMVPLLFVTAPVKAMQVLQKAIKAVKYTNMIDLNVIKVMVPPLSVTAHLKAMQVSLQKVIKARKYLNEIDMYVIKVNRVLSFSTMAAATEALQLLVL